MERLKHLCANGDKSQKMKLLSGDRNCGFTWHDPKASLTAKSLWVWQSVERDAMIENARYCSNLKMRVLSFPAAMCKNLSMFFMRSITLRRMRGCVTLALICVVVVCERWLLGLVWLRSFLLCNINISYRSRGCYNSKGIGMWLYAWPRGVWFWDEKSAHGYWIWSWLERLV